MRVGMRRLPARVGLAEKAPRERLAAATVATSVAMLQTRYYVGCRLCRRCRQQKCNPVPLYNETYALPLTPASGCQFAIKGSNSSHGNQT